MIWSTLAQAPKKIFCEVKQPGYTPLGQLSDHRELPLPAFIKSEFEVVRRNKVYEEVARQIERLILKKLKPGDKLPSERELAEMLRVSRSSIRDAIPGLELAALG